MRAVALDFLAPHRHTSAKSVPCSSARLNLEVTACKPASLCATPCPRDRESSRPADPTTTGRIHAESAARLVMTPQGRAPVTALEPLQRGLEAAEVARAAAGFGRRNFSSRRCRSRRDRDGSSRRRRCAGRRRDCCSSHRCFSRRRRDECQRGAGRSTAAAIHAAAIMGGGVVVSAAGGAASWKSSCKMRT